MVFLLLYGSYAPYLFMHLWYNVFETVYWAIPVTGLEFTCKNKDHKKWYKTCTGTILNQIYNYLWTLFWSVFSLNWLILHTWSCIIFFQFTFRHTVHTLNENDLNTERYKNCLWGYHWSDFEFIISTEITANSFGDYSPWAYVGFFSDIT